MAERLENIKIKEEKKVRYYKNIEYPKIEVDPNDIYIIAKLGDRLDLLANDFYGDSRYWWIISRANCDKIKTDSFFIDPGLQIRIPSNVEIIYDEFEKLNR